MSSGEKMEKRDSSSARSVWTMRHSCACWSGVREDEQYTRQMDGDLILLHQIFSSLALEKNVKIVCLLLELFYHTPQDVQILFILLGVHRSIMIIFMSFFRPIQFFFLSSANKKTSAKKKCVVLGCCHTARVPNTNSHI
jgi:hypothetical protein